MSSLKIGDWVRTVTGDMAYNGLEGVVLSLDGPKNEAQVELFSKYERPTGTTFSIYELELLEGWDHARDSAVEPNFYKFPSGAEVKHISGYLTAFSAQALQYIARSSRIDGKNKGNTVEDLEKAITFLRFEIERLTK
jgi:hypothetical protein